MPADEKIDPLLPYRGIRPLREGNVFAKYKVRKKQQSREKPSEEQAKPEVKDQSKRGIDIEV